MWLHVSHVSSSPAVSSLSVLVAVLVPTTPSSSAATMLQNLWQSGVLVSREGYEANTRAAALMCLTGQLNQKCTQSCRV
mgnify:CR=1 FL=1